MPLLSIAGRSLARLISSIFPPAAPRHPVSRLRIESLEARVVPASYAVRLLSPGEGVLGDTAATHSGSLALVGVDTRPITGPKSSIPSTNTSAILFGRHRHDRGLASRGSTSATPFSSATAKTDASAHPTLSCWNKTP